MYYELSQSYLSQLLHPYVVHRVINFRVFKNVTALKLSIFIKLHKFMIIYLLQL